LKKIKLAKLINLSIYLKITISSGWGEKAQYSERASAGLHRPGWQIKKERHP
jgi:hypothetical protein